MNADTRQPRLHWLGRRIARAQREHRLFTAGDRVLVGFSGGKDSLALLHALPVWAAGSGLDLDIAAIHVAVAGAPSFREELAATCEALGLPLLWAEFTPDPAGPGPDGRITHPCFRCARHRREALLRYAADHEWSTIALGHHLDDDAETVLMNQFYLGQTRGLAPRREYLDGRVTLVRPLIMAEEKEIVDVTRSLGARPIACTCPDGREVPPDSSRQRIKEFLRSLGREATTAKRHLQRLGQSSAD